LQKWWRQYQETGAFRAAAGAGLAGLATAAPLATAMAATANAIRRVRMEVGIVA